MHNLYRKLFLTALLIGVPVLAGPFPRVDADLLAYDRTITSLDSDFAQIPVAPHDKNWVKQKLTHMVETDQYTIRYYNTMYDHNYSEQEKQYFQPLMTARYQNIAKVHAADLKELLKIYEWFTISAFGKDADNDAWLLVQHDDQEIDFQKSILALLSRLYPKGESNPSHYGYLYDRVARNEVPPRLQRFGTQGRCVGPGQWEPWPIEDEANVDKRRAELGMVTMAEYKTWFKDICKEKQ